MDDKLPKGWTAATDPESGQTYYHNENTEVSTWHRPLDDEPPLVIAVTVAENVPEPAGNFPTTTSSTSTSICQLPISKNPTNETTINETTTASPGSGMPSFSGNKPFPRPSPDLTSSQKEAMSKASLLPRPESVSTEIPTSPRFNPPVVTAPIPPPVAVVASTLPPPPPPSSPYQPVPPPPSQLTLPQVYDPVEVTTTTQSGYHQKADGTWQTPSSVPGIGSQLDYSIDLKPIQPQSQPQSPSSLQPLLPVGTPASIGNRSALPPVITTPPLHPPSLRLPSTAHHFPLPPPPSTSSSANDHVASLASLRRLGLGQLRGGSNTTPGASRPYGRYACPTCPQCQG